MLSSSQQRFASTKVAKFLNLALVFLLLVGSLPVSAQAAVQQQSAELCKRSSGSGAGKLFLPLITKGTQQILALMASGSAEAQAPTARVLAYEVGKSYQYDYEVVINTNSAKRDSQGTRTDGAAKSVIAGQANVQVTAKENDGTFVGQVSLQDPYICNTNGTGESMVNDEELVTALTVPLVFKQAATGEIKSVSIPQNASAQATNIQKGVLNALQVTLKEGSSYTAAEAAGQGTVTATYTVEDKADGAYITKKFQRVSFTSLISSGQTPQDLKLENTINLVLDKEKGVLTAVTYTEKMATGDGQGGDPNNEELGFDGVTAWSTAETTGKLSLKGVVASVNAAVALDTYQVDSLGGTLSTGHPNFNGIDLTKINVDAELAKLEAAPDTPDNRAYIIALIDADDDPYEANSVLNKIKARLLVNAANAAIANAYIDILGSVGRQAIPGNIQAQELSHVKAAQEILAAVLGNSQVGAASLAFAPFNDETREQALINVAILESPTITVVNTVAALVTPGGLGRSRSSINETAIGVLGAVVNNLADENADEAAKLTSTLEQGLTNTVSSGDIGLYLDALGNAGQPSSLAIIKQYINYTAEISTTARSTAVITEVIDVQAAALVALRKIPGDEAESLLLGSLNDNNELDVVRSLVANVLSSREALSDNAAASLNAFTQQPLASPGRHERSWNRLIGNADLGVEFPGGFTLMSPPARKGIYVYTHQKAVARIYGRHLNALSGEIRLYRSSATAYTFGAYLNIGGNLLRRQYETTVPCDARRNGKLYSGSITFINVTFSIPVFAVITIDVNVQATGHFELTYRLNIDACDPANMTASAGITPNAWATASGSASLNLQLARGGVTLSATLLNTKIPASVTAGYNATSNKFSFCVDIGIETKPLDGGLDIWADTKVFRRGWPPYKWSRVGEARLWSFSTPARNYNLLDRCF